MTMRRTHCAPGRLPEVIEAGLPLVEKINERFGVSLGASINIGGDPDLVGLSGAWETMGAYQDYRAALMADEELSAAGAAIGAMTNYTEDVIGRVLAPPGDAAAYSVLNQVRMHMPRIAEAIPFGLEICEMVEDKIGLKTGLIAATTGDRSVLAFVGRLGSLDEAAETAETLEADPEYLELFKRSEGLFVDGSLEQSLWQRLN